MRKFLIFLLGIFLFLLFGYWCIYEKAAPFIQTDLTEKTNSGLKNSGLESVNVKLDGRDVLLTGTVNDQAHRSQAEKAVKVVGVRLIDNQIIVNKSDQRKYRLFTENDGANITLDGFVPDSITHHNMVSYVMEIFDNTSVKDNLVERSNPPEDWTIISKAGLDALQKLDRGQLKINNNTLELSGNVSSPTERDSITSQLSKTLPENYTINTNIAIRAKPKNNINNNEEHTSKNNLTQCQQRLNSLMAGSSIGFRTGSAEITPTGISVLDRIIPVVTDCNSYQLIVKSHTDASGSKKLNQSLSEKRAIAVKKHLIKKGISEKRITARGYGETQPITENNTAKGRNMNRRIEITIEAAEDNKE